MKKLHLFIIGIVFCLPIFSQNSLNADIVVAKDGSGDFVTIQAAINSVPDNSSRRTVIYIKRGKYDTEKLIVPASKQNITMIGESRDETVISYHMHNCTTTETGMCPAESYELWKADSELIRTSATFTVLANGFIAENLTFENTAGPVGQALALTARGDRGIYRNCNFLSYQDTIYLWDAGKRTYFEDCLVVGRTDYIYGGGIGYFKSCEIRSWGGGWITAPSTRIDQDYGFVFYECKLTYSDGSPRSGDDGVKFALGRPWHEYPKVSWLYCEMSEMLNPLGWPTKWNMEYSDTSTDLKLYEYKCNGAGADMSGRAPWAGLRAMKDDEAPNYTAQKVMAGNDDWDPTAIASPIKSYKWTGTDSLKSWLNAGNWNPAGIPGTGESATVTGDFTLLADGDSLNADLNLNQGAKLDIIANSTATYIALAGGEINASAASSLSGKIQTKAPADFNITSNLDVKATLSGVHAITKKGNGELTLSSDNNNYYGNIDIEAGTLKAAAVNSMGQGNTTVKNGATLIFDADNAFSVKSALRIENGGKAVLNSPVTLNELYIDNTMMEPGTYSAATHPAVFSGLAAITVGRPTMFVWSPSATKTWENAANYKPALLPGEGDTVTVTSEMEINATPYAAVILLQQANLRFRANAVSTADIVMSAGTMLSYATSGAGFALDANVKLLGNITLMVGGNGNGGQGAVCHMTFTKGFEGDSTIKVTAYNHTDTKEKSSMTGKIILNGDNSNFSGTWDLTRAARISGRSIMTIEGAAAKAFGKGSVDVAAGNKVVFSHAEAAGTDNTLTLAKGTKAVMNTGARAGKLKLDGVEYTEGLFNAVSHPDFFEGTGTLAIGNTPNSVDAAVVGSIYFDGEKIVSPSAINRIKIYSVSGKCIAEKYACGDSVPLDLNPGLYIIELNIDNKNIYMKIVR